MELRVDYAFKFDWLQVSVFPDFVASVHSYNSLEAYLKAVYKEIKDIFPPGCVLADTGQSVKFYKMVMSVVDDGEVIAVIAAQSTEQAVMVKIPGGNDALCRYLIAHPVYSRSTTKIQRVDLALDIWEDTLSFLGFARALNDISVEFGYSSSTAGDWLNGVKGRTLYIGSRSSFCFTRWYEKSKQLMLPDAEQKYNRLEFEFKPGKVKDATDDFLRDFKSVIRDYSLGVVGKLPFQYSNFSIKAIGYLSGLDLEIISKSERRDRPELKSLAHMCVQYSNICSVISKHYDIDYNLLLQMVDIAKQSNIDDSTIKQKIYSYIKSNFTDKP